MNPISQQRNPPLGPQPQRSIIAACYAFAGTMQATVVRRVFKAFQYRDFRLMWIGACTSSIGTWMQIVAQGWLIYRLSHSAFLLALDQFLGGIPIFLFSLIGGVVADRVERRKILLGSQYVQMATAGLLTILVATGLVHVWHILCLSFISGFAQAFGGPAYQALIPTLVEKEDMPNAIALNSIQFNVAVMVGPGTRRAGLGEAGRKMVLRLERAFLPRAHHFAVDHHRPFPAGEDHGVHVHQPEAGHSIRPQAEFDGSADRAGFLHDRFEHAHAHLLSGIRERHLPSRSGNLRQSARAHGTGFDLRLADHRQRGQYAKKGTRRAGRASLPGRGNCRVRSFEIACRSAALSWCWWALP